MSLDTMHLKDPLVLFGSSCSALSLLSLHAFSLFFNNGKNFMEVFFMAIDWPNVPMCLFKAPIHSYHPCDHQFYTGPNVIAW